MERKARRTHRNQDGNLYVRYLNRDDDRWNWNDNWLDNDWNSDNPAAVSATLFMNSSGETPGNFV